MRISPPHLPQANLRQLPQNQPPSPETPPEPQDGAGPGQEPPDGPGPIKWGQVGVLLGVVGGVTGLAGSGIGYVSPIAGALVGGIAGGIIGMEMVERSLGGKDSSGVWLFSTGAGLLGLAAGGTAGTMLASSGGSPGIGLAIGVTAAVAAFGAGFYTRNQDSKPN